MKIVVENSSYGMHNWGDMAMLGIALRRLHEVAPDAELQVLTFAPSRVRGLDPSATPVLAGPERSGYGEGPSSGVKRLLRPLLRSAVVRRVLAPLRRWRLAPYRSAVHARIEAADLLVASGGGYLTDVFADKCDRSLALMTAAIRADVPIALLGQGLGPVEDETRLRRLRSVVSAASVVALRDPAASGDLARSAGVSEDHLRITGDDAIELATYDGERPLGDRVGVNLRTASYADIGAETERALGAALASSLASFASSVQPLPIASAGSYSDVDTLVRTLAHARLRSDGGADVASLEVLLERMSACRVVVTGSYHAGVFALAQGMPVVAVSSSAYYDRKFTGLATAFGVPDALTLVRPGDHDEPRHALHGAIERAWVAAERVREPLRAAARRQILASRDAYRAAIDAIRS